MQPTDQYPRFYDLLICTGHPFLGAVPHRGSKNYPTWVLMGFCMLPGARHDVSALFSLLQAWAPGCGICFPLRASLGLFSFSLFSLLPPVAWLSFLHASFFYFLQFSLLSTVACLRCMHAPLFPFLHTVARLSCLHAPQFPLLSTLFGFL